MSICQADSLAEKLFTLTAPGEVEVRTQIRAVLREISETPKLIERLERMDPQELLSFLSVLRTALPLKSIEELENILSGNHEHFPWKPKANHFKPIEILNNSIKEVKEIIQTPTNKTLRKLCFIQLVAALEAYLGDLLKNTVLSSPKRIENLLHRDKELSKATISLHEAYTDPKLPEAEAKKYLSRQLYHNFPKVIALYQISLEVDIRPQESCYMKALIQAVTKRHDLVHRNGFNTKGDMVIVDFDDIKDLIQLIEDWVEHIETQITLITN